MMGTVQSESRGLLVIVPVAVLAEYASVTADGKLNILGIFDTIYGTSLPVETSGLRLVMQMQTEPQDRGTAVAIAIRMLDAHGHNLLPHPLQRLIVPEQLPPHVNRPQVVEFNGVHFEDFGDYVFTISVNEEEKARVPFRVVRKPDPPGAVNEAAV